MGQGRCQLERIPLLRLQSNERSNERNHVHGEPARPRRPDAHGIARRCRRGVRVDPKANRVAVRVLEARVVRGTVERGAVAPRAELDSSNQPLFVRVGREIDNAAERRGAHKVERRAVRERRGCADGDQDEQHHRDERDGERGDEVSLCHAGLTIMGG